MKFQEIDRLAQSVDKLPDIANLGDRSTTACGRYMTGTWLASWRRRKPRQSGRSCTRRTGSIGSRRQRT